MYEAKHALIAEQRPGGIRDILKRERVSQHENGSIPPAALKCAAVIRVVDRSAVHRRENSRIPTLTQTVNAVLLLLV